MAKININLNGTRQKIDQSSISDLLLTLKLSPNEVIVELNATILTKDNLDQNLTENDTVEIIRYIGGGALKPLLK